MASLLAWASERTSPCLPSYIRKSPISSRPLNSNLVGGRSTHLPLGETEVHLAAALGVQAGSLLERPAHGAGGNGQVAVVTGNRVSDC